MQLSNLWKHGPNQKNLKRPFRWLPKPVLMIIVVLFAPLVAICMGVATAVSEVEDTIKEAWETY